MARTKPSAGEPVEWQEGTEAARAARALVAQQFTELLLERDMTGGRENVGFRLRQLGEAEKTQDLIVVRAAVMEVCVAAGSWASAIDLGQRQGVPAAA